MQSARWYFTAALLMISLAARAQQPIPVQPAQPPQPNRTDILIRTYNVADLMRLTNDYPLSMSLRQAMQLGQSADVRAGGGGGGGNLYGGVVVGNARSAPAIELGPLGQLLVSTVDPSSWSENGGQTGSIRPISSMLVITQTRANHDTIQSLLDEIRRNAGPTQVVTIRATWVQTDAGKLLTPSTEVTADWISQQKLYCESQITCFSGQTVHLSSGLGKNTVDDLTPIVGTNAVAFDPQIQTVVSGVALQFAPQLIPGNESVILDVQTAVSELPAQDEQAQVSAVAYPTLGERDRAETKTTASIDRSKMVRQEFQTTARVPLRKKVVVGGMTLEPTSAEQAGRQLYLLVEIDTVK